MTSKIAIIADQDTVTGFMLGGIKEGYPVEDLEQADKTIEELVKKEYSILITTEKIGDGLREKIDNLTSERALPMIIEIPDKTGSIERETDPLRELIKRVIGVEMVK